MDPYASAKSETEAESETPPGPDSIAFISSQWLKSKRPEVKPSTFNKYLNQINSYLLPAFGAMRAEEITDDAVHDFCTELQATGGAKGQGLSAKTVTDSLSVLRRILRFSYKKGYSPTLVCPQTKVRKEEKEIRVLSDKEQERLCEYLKEDLDDPRRRGVLLCLFTGLRIGELCGLTWDDISFTDHTIRIERTLQRIQIPDGQGPKTMIAISTPKSACSIRTIPLMDDMARILEAHRGTGYFLTDSADKFMEPRTMENYFKSVLKDCGIPAANFHSLRHSFGTRCVEMGFDVKSLSEILGHANVNITMNRYVHPSMDMKRQNMQRLNTLIGGNKPSDQPSDSAAARP